MPFAGASQVGTVIVGVRAGPDQPRRARNAAVALGSLNRQTLERRRYRVIVIEQDRVPHCGDALKPLADQYLFVHNPGPYNRGWGFNVGVSLAGFTGAFCLFDADLVATRDFLAECFGPFRAGPTAGGIRALKPHSSIEYLDEAASAALTAAAAGGECDLEQFRGRAWEAVGGTICVDGALYREMGGHDERFRGWGSEDKEFWARLNRPAAVPMLEKRMVHLAHEGADQDDEAARQNRRLRARKQGGENGWPDGPVGDPLRYAGEIARG
jgi:hypothetical protein